MKKTPILFASNLLILIVLFTASLKSMESEPECKTCSEYNKGIQSVDTLYKTLRTSMFAQAPFKKHALEDVDDENILSFKKREIKASGLLPLFEDDPETTKLFLVHVFYNTFAQKQFRKIVPMYDRYPGITLDSREIQETIKDYCVELLFQKFHLPAKKRQLATCTCTKATLYDKIGCALKVISKLPTLFPSDQCTAHQPLSGEYFGSGLLLSEYLLSYILGKRGYHYQNLHCFDKSYSENNECRSLFNEFQKHLRNNGITTNINVFSDTSGFFEFKQINPINNHLVIAIDPGDKQQITTPDLLHQAKEAYIVFLNEDCNQQHATKIDFSDMNAILIAQRDANIDNTALPMQKSKKMMRQINNFISLLCSINHQQNQVAYIHTLLGIVQKKGHKFEKSENTTGYTALKVGWHTKPTACI